MFKNIVEIEVKGAVCVENVLIINMKERISKNLSLRLYAEDLFKDIELYSQNNIVLNFNGVEFASRSFTQEFLYRIQRCSKQIELISQSSEVKKMFEIVKSPREKTTLAYYNPDRVIQLTL